MLLSVSPLPSQQSLLAELLKRKSVVLQLWRCVQLEWRSGQVGWSRHLLKYCKEAFKIHDGREQNYVSPNTANPGIDDHSSFQTPQVRTMVNPGRGGLNQVSTAPMAPGTESIGNTPFPSGSFNYGFDNGKIKPYRGAYPQTGGAGGPYGGMLPNVSLGSVDFNTVDTSGIAPVGMGSPGRGVCAPIGRPVVQIPNSFTSTQSTLNWLQNSFFRRRQLKPSFVAPPVSIDLQLATVNKNVEKTPHCLLDNHSFSGSSPSSNL